MKSVCFVLSALTLAVVLQCRPSVAAIESVCQLHQLEFPGNDGTFILSGQVRYVPPLSPAMGAALTNADPVYFNNTYNIHIHSSMYEGTYFKGFLKIVDKHYFVIKTSGGGNGSAAMELERTVTTTGNSKTITQSRMETLFKSIINGISSFSSNGTKLIFQGPMRNLVCNRIPAF